MNVHTTASSCLLSPRAPHAVYPTIPPSSNPTKKLYIYIFVTCIGSPSVYSSNKLNSISESIQSRRKKKIMLESAATLVSWALSFFTPTLLFFLLNLIVLTIVLSSSTSTSTSTSTNKLSRSTSIVLDRLKSFNLYSYSPTETLTVIQQPEVPIAPSQSDTKPAAGKVPKKLRKKKKKSETVKSAFNHFELGDDNVVDDERKEKEKPATMRERVVKKEVEVEEEEEVNSRADDFINKFRHQLKLQRLDSIARRGTRRC